MPILQMSPLRCTAVTWLVQGGRLLWQSLASFSFAFGKTGWGWG